MPYEGERASKASHFDLVDNPDVSVFLDDCEYKSEPEDYDLDEIGGKYELPPSIEDVTLPERIIAVDGSRHESAITDKLPSTRVGYAKISTVLIRMDEYSELRDGRFVDPFKVAKLREGQEALTFPLPSSNVKVGGCHSVQESFRVAVDRQLASEMTRFENDDPSTSLRSTLFEVAVLKPERKNGNSDVIVVPRCPSEDCDEEDIQVTQSEDTDKCSSCGAKVYPADALRLWEEVSEYQSNLTPLTRFMNLIEHLMPIHLIRYFAEIEAYQALSGTTFILDGPLALFGTVASLHRGILRFLSDINSELHDRDLEPIVVIGLQKSGHLAEHANMMERFVPNDRLLLVDDEYRYKHVVTREPSDNGFGAETYYGQDFVYRTPSGRTFVFALPFPEGAKDSDAAYFRRTKEERENYADVLGKALKVINHFESDLHRNAVVPIALAHRYTAISLRPGGRVLDLLTRRKIGTD